MKVKSHIRRMEELRTARETKQTHIEKRKAKFMRIDRVVARIKWQIKSELIAKARKKERDNNKKYA